MKTRRLSLSIVAFTAALTLLGAPGVRAQQPVSLADATRIAIDASYPPGFTHEATLEALDKAIDTFAATPFAWLLVSREIALASRPESPPSVWKRIAARLERKDLHGLARHTIEDATADRLRDRGELVEADKLSPNRDYLTHALAIGPFGDEGGLFHGVRYPPEYSEPALDAELQGRFGPVAWRTVTRRKSSTRLDLTPDGDQEKSRGCHYALIQVKSPEARPAWLQTWCSDSFELWWNGERCASINRQTERHPSTLFPSIRLRKGWNRCLIKTTRATSASLSLRIVDANGATLRGLEPEPRRVVHEIAAAGDSAPPVAAFVTEVDWLEAEVARAGDAASPSALALLANLLARSAAPDRGLVLARKALELAPGDRSVRAACFEAFRLARHVPPDLIRTELRRLLDGLDAAGLEHRHLFLAKTELLFDDDKREDALRLLDARLAKNPDELATLHEKYRMLARLRWDGEARRALERLVVLAPRSPRFTLDLARIEERDGHPHRALERVERMLRDLPGRRELLDRALTLSRKVGDAARAERYREQLYRDDPTGDEAVLARASALEDAGDAAAAAAMLVPLAAQREGDGDLRKRIGDLYWTAGDADSAMRYYRESLTLRPEQHELRSWTLRASGGTEFAECEPFLLDAAAEVAAFTPRAEDEAAPTTLVLDQMLVRVYDDGSQMEETHVLRRVNDQRGVEQCEQADAAAEADELLELRTIHADGNWFAPHRVSGTFSMPRLMPGCFLEERYRNFKPSPGARPIDFVRFFFRGLERPFRFSRLVVLLPKGQQLGRFVTRNFPEADLTTRDLGDLTAYVFQRKDMPKVTAEEHMPGLEEIAPWVTFGRAPSLETFVREQRAAFEHFTMPYRELSEKANELVAGAGNDREKARRIHEFAQRHTPDAIRRPGSPYPVSVLLKGEGDRFFLQLALLDAAGIEWTPALIHPVPPEMDHNPEPFLNPTAYYTVRAAFVRPRESEPFWIVQGTPRHYPFAELPATIGPSPAAGCPYLLLEGNTGVPGRMPGKGVSELADLRVRGTATIGDDGGAHLDVTLSFPGNQGYLIKEQIGAQSKSAQQMIGRQFAAFFFRGFTVRKVELLGADTEGAPLRVALELERRDFVQRAGTELVLPPLLAESRLTRRFGGRGERKHPFSINDLTVSDWDLLIDPGKHRFGALPEGTFRRALLIDYGESYALEGDKLRVRRVSVLRPGRIAPSRYREFLDLCQEIDNAESRPIRLER